MKLQVSVCDRIEITDRRRTGDGFLATKGRISRTGLYTYLKGEVGAEGNPNDRVQIYRGEEAVFSDESMGTFAHRPLTLNHPPSFVDASNWKKYSVGHAGSKVRRDGDFVEIDMLILDGEAISAVENGAMISPGYVATVDMTPGTTPDGQHFDGQMIGPFKGNHIAILAGATPNGRGGPECRIGDAWPVETKDSVPPQKEARKMKIVYDGLTVDLSDESAASAFAKKLTDKAEAATALLDAANKVLADAEAKAATELAAKDAAIAVKDAEIASLTKAVEDAKVTPEQMREMAKAHSILTDAATKMGFTVTDAMSDAEIKKGAVLARLGDAYKDKSEAFFDAAFEIESAKTPAADPYRLAMGDRKATDFADASTEARKARQEMIDRLANPAREEAK